MLTAVSIGFSISSSSEDNVVRQYVYTQSTDYQPRSQGFSLLVPPPPPPPTPREGQSPGNEGYPNPILVIKDVRAQKFPRTDFFKTLTAGRK